MPLYEYACKSCGGRFELLVRRGASPSCPSCAGTELERLPSLPNVKSTGTHAAAMRAAKKRDRAQGREQMHAQREYELKHND